MSLRLYCQEQCCQKRIHWLMRRSLQNEKKKESVLIKNFTNKISIWVFFLLETISFKLLFDPFGNDAFKFTRHPLPVLEKFWYCTGGSRIFLKGFKPLKANVPPFGLDRGGGVACSHQKWQKWPFLVNFFDHRIPESSPPCPLHIH